LVVLGLGIVFDAFGVMLTTILQVPFAKFLIPDNVKNSETPRKPPGKKLGHKWKFTTRRTANPRTPSSDEM